jgi:hypothetical protein
MVDELCSGPCIAVEICGEGDVHKAFRDFVGPSDPVSYPLFNPSQLFPSFYLIISPKALKNP